MKKIFLQVCFSLLMAGSAVSQDHLFGISWEMNFPTNSDYLDEPSFAGGKFEYRYFVKKNFSIGMAVNWASYEQKVPRQTFEKPDGNSAVTSDFVAIAYQVPITATAHYYFNKMKFIEPYVGIAMGAQSLVQDLYYNVYISSNSSWGFVVRPEVGVIIKPDSFNGWGFLVNAGYSYATNETEAINRNNFSNVGVGLGVVFTTR